MTESENNYSNSDNSMIFVHGHDFKPPADVLLDIDVAALAAGIERDRPELFEKFHALHKQQCYYGDCTNEFLSSVGEYYDESLDVGDRRNALLRLKSVEKIKHFSVARYDRLPGKTALAEFAADLAAPLLGSIGFSKALINSVGKDLAEYWNPKSDFATMLRGRVRDAVIESLERGDRILLVAHGTGSIVTYDVLWQLSHDPEFADRYSAHKIDTLLTLGSPLGDSIVRRRLLGAKRKGRERYPVNIVSWHNVAAEDDFMCHDNTLVNDYKAMLKQRQISSIRDHHIYNLAIRYGKSNPHSSVGYLIHPKTIQVVTDWITNDTAALLPTSSG